MSTSDFPSIAMVKVADTSEKVYLGTRTSGSDYELEAIRVLILIAGTRSGSEQLRINIYGDDNLSSVLYQSEWADLADAGDNWRGWVGCQFAGENISANNVYYLEAELNNYTRNALTFYVGYLYDFPYSVYGSSGAWYFEENISMQILGEL